MNEQSMQDRDGAGTSGRSWDGPSIFRSTAITFDPGDKLNGSLYLCDPGGVHGLVIAKVIAHLRGKSLWSEQDPKQVRDDQRQAYEEQLLFVEAVEFVADGVTLVAARCNHPKFPSSAERFADWKKALAGFDSRQS